MKKVLLINDSKLQNQIMRDTLISMNYEVHISDEYNALVAVNEFCPDLIITNYILKELNGEQLISMIKIQHPDIKCVLSSSSDLHINDFDDSKINGIIKTPIDKEELKKFLDNLENEPLKKFNDDRFEVKKYCRSCKSFVDVIIDKSYLFCAKCNGKLWEAK